MGETVGYVVLTKRIGVEEQWLCDHSGEPLTKTDAILEGLAFVRDNEDYEYAVGAVTIGSDL